MYHGDAQIYVQSHTLGDHYAKLNFENEITLEPKFVGESRLVVDSNLYIFGGIDGKTEMCTNRFIRYSPISGTWYKIDVPPTIEPIQGAKLLYIDGEIFIIGGAKDAWGIKKIDDIHSYNIYSGKFTSYPKCQLPMTTSNIVMVNRHKKLDIMSKIAFFQPIIYPVAGTEGIGIQLLTLRDNYHRKGGGLKLLWAIKSIVQDRITDLLYLLTSKNIYCIDLNEQRVLSKMS